MNTVSIKKPHGLAAPLLLAAMVFFVATLLPPSTGYADTPTTLPADGLSATGDGTGGTETLAGPSPLPESPEALGTVDLSTGTARSRFPFVLPKARGDAQPSLALTYNSAAGVGMAGVGWTLGISSIVRKGSSGLPRFVDDVLTDTSVTSPSTTLKGDLYADDYYVDGHLLVPILRVEDGGGGGSLATNEAMPQWALQVSAGNAWTYFRTEIDDGKRYFLSADGKTWRVQTRADRRLSRRC